MADLMTVEMLSTSVQELDDPLGSILEMACLNCPISGEDWRGSSLLSFLDTSI